MPAADSGSPRRMPSRALSATSLTLHLGVVDQPYRAWVMNAKRTRRVKGAKMPITTGDVAQILEANYGLFSVFARVASKDITAAIENSLQGALETLMMGHAIDPWGSGTQAIDQRFRDFIASKEAESVGIPGTPTLAALKGVNHRLKHPYSSRNPRRPSFRDTGLLMASFRSWVD